jgi:hypothetical protein
MEEQYAAFDALVAGSRAGRSTRAVSSELLKQGQLIPVRCRLSTYPPTTHLLSLPPGIEISGRALHTLRDRGATQA